MYIDVYEHDMVRGIAPLNPEALQVHCTRRHDLGFKLTFDHLGLKLCDDLADKLDPIRKKYWRYRKSQLESRGAN